MKKKLKILGIFFLVIILFAALGILYLLLNEFSIPKSVKNRITDITKSYYGLDFDYDLFKIDLPSNKLFVSSFTLSVEGKPYFVSFGSATIELASSSEFFGLLPNKTEVNKIVINDLFYDMTAPQIEEASGAFKLPSIPAKETFLNGFIINSPYGKFDLSKNNIYIKNDIDDLILNLDIPNGPFGISAYFNSLINQKTKIASISLQIEHKSLGDCSPLEVYASENNISVDGGKFKLNLNYIGNIENRINNPLEDIVKFLNEELSGNICLNDFDLKWKGIGFQGSLNINKAINERWDYNLKGKLAKGDVSVKGKWLGQEDNLTKLEANFDISNLNFTKESLIEFGVPSFDFIPGSIGFNGKIQGDIASYSGSGVLFLDSWHFFDKELKKIKLNWDLSEDLVLKTNGVVDTELGNLNTNSTVWLQGENKYKGVLNGKLEKLELNKVGEIAKIPLEGICKGPFSLEFDCLNPLNSIYAVDFTIDNGKAFQFNSKHIAGNISGKGTDWKILNPYVLLNNNGEIIVDGFIASSSLDVKVKINNIDFRTFGLSEDIASGNVQLEAIANGTLSSPYVKGNLYGNNIFVMGLPFKTFKSDFRVKNRILSLVPFVIKPVDGSLVDGYFTIDLNDAKVLNARLNFQQLCLELFKPYLPDYVVKNKTEGIFGGYISYSRLKNENFVKALIDGRDLMLLGQELDSIYIEAESIGKQAELKSFYLKGLGGNVNLTGHIANAQKFSGSIKGENFKFNRMDFFKNYIPDLNGILDFQGDIDWDGKSRKGNFIVFAKDIKTDERELGNYGGEIIIDDEKLEIKNGEFDKIGIKLSGDLKWGGRKPYNFKLDLDNVDFSFIPQAHDLDVFENGSLMVDGDCVVKGDLASLTPNLAELKLDNIRIQKDGDVIVNNKPISIVYQKGATEIRSFELKYKLGVLNVEGLISDDNNTEIVIKGDHFSAKALGHMCGIRSFNYDGDVSLNSRIYGKIDDLKYNSQADIDNLVVEGREIPKFQANIEGDGSKLNVKETFVKLKNNSFNLKGYIDLDNFVPQKLNLNLSIPKGPIKDLEEYWPKVIKIADGLINGELDITGKPNNPEITGDLHLNGNKIQLTSMKKPFTNIVFDMKTDDLITTVNTLKASMGKGIIEGYGNVDFKNASGSLDVHLKGEKLDLPFMSLDVFNASGSVDLTGDIYNPIVDCKIYIPKGKLGLNSNLFPEKKESKPIFNSLNYRVEVDVPRNFWVKNAFINSEMKGKCIVTGDLENFKIEGGIKTIQGKIFFKQRQFKIQNGEIKFGGVDNSLDPYIFVKSEGQVQSTKIYLTLQGNLSNFKPQVYSTPPMSEGDIIAMLTLGRDLNAVSNSDTKDLFEDEVLEGLKNSYISALIGDSISAALNLDELYLTSAFDKTTGKSQSYVRIGKYISDKIFMAYEGTMSDDKDESYIFEYRLPKGFVFSIEFEQPENNQNYGIRYDWKF